MLRYPKVKWHGSGTLGDGKRDRKHSGLMVRDSLERTDVRRSRLGWRVDSLCWIAYRRRWRLDRLESLSKAREGSGWAATSIGDSEG